MICLTSDIHHHSLKYEEKKYMSDTSLRLGLKYAKIAKDYGLKVSFFITGITFEEEGSDVQELLKKENIEIGGHTFSALRFKGIAKIVQSLTRKPYNIGYYQKKDIVETIKTIKESTGKKIKIWRTHSYASDDNTLELLGKNGIKVISDERAKEKLCPYYLEKYGLYSLPINVIPDHPHLFHGKRTEGHVRNLKWKGDSFGKESYYAPEWLEIVKNQVRNIASKGGIATLAVHPQCMDVVDDFKTFKKLCQFLSNYKSIFTSEAVEYAK